MFVSVSASERSSSSPLAAALTAALLAAPATAVDSQVASPPPVTSSASDLGVIFSRLHPPGSSNLQKESLAVVRAQEPEVGTVKWVAGKILDAWGDWLLPILGTTITWILATANARREHRRGVLAHGVSGEVVFWTGDSIAVRSFMEGSIPQEWGSSSAATGHIRKAIVAGRKFPGVPFLNLAPDLRHIVLDPLVAKESAKFGVDWLSRAATAVPGEPINEQPLIITLAYERYASQKLRALAIAPQVISSILENTGNWWRSAGDPLPGRSATHETAATSKCRIVTLLKFATLAVLNQPEDLLRVMAAQKIEELKEKARKFERLLLLDSTACSKILDAAYPTDRQTAGNFTPLESLSQADRAGLLKIHQMVKSREFFQDFRVPN